MEFETRIKRPTKKGLSATGWLSLCYRFTPRARAARRTIWHIQPKTSAGGARFTISSRGFATPCKTVTKAGQGGKTEPTGKTRGFSSSQAGKRSRARALSERTSHSFRIPQRRGFPHLQNLKKPCRDLDETAKSARGSQGQQSAGHNLKTGFPHWRNSKEQAILFYLGF